MDYMEALKKYRGIADNILAETQVEAPAETRRSNGLVQRIQAQAESDVENTIAGLTRRKEPKKNEEVTPEDSIAAFMAAGRYEQLARGEEGIDTRAMVEGAPDVFRTAGVSYGGTSDLLGLIDKTEGAGNYNTLFGHAQKEGRAFAGTNITDMTIGQLKAFTDPSGAYGQWVKTNNPKKQVATPLGRYQFVGSTMSAIADKMGLPDNTVFTPEVQDRMFAYHARETLRGKQSDAAKLSAIRSQWDGFRHVDDATLLSALDTFMSNTSVIPQSRG